MNTQHFIHVAAAKPEPSAEPRSTGTASARSGDSLRPCEPRGDSGCHQLLFASLYHPGRGVAVPCDAGGHVDLDALPKRLLTSYLSARAMLGREYAYPVVQRVH